MKGVASMTIIAILAIAGILLVGGQGLIDVGMPAGSIFQQLSGSVYDFSVIFASQISHVSFAGTK